MANSIIDVAQLLAHNQYGPTDFTIQLNERKWQVNFDLLLRESNYFAPYFRSRIATLYQFTPRTVARLIQWIYLGGYEYPFESTSPIAPNLHQLVPDAGHVVNEEEDYVPNKDRKSAVVNLCIARIAATYEVGRLSALTQKELVSYLERVPQRRLDFWEMYIRILPVLENSMREDDSLTKRMVEFLMAYKFGNLGTEAPFINYIVPNEDEVRLIDESLPFYMDIAGRIREGGDFAVQLVHALENALQKSLQNPNWALGNLPLGGGRSTSFGEWPANYPFDLAKQHGQ